MPLNGPAAVYERSCVDALVGLCAPPDQLNSCINVAEEAALRECATFNDCIASAWISNNYAVGIILTHGAVSLSSQQFTTLPSPVHWLRNQSMDFPMSFLALLFDVTADDVIAYKQDSESLMDLAFIVPKEGDDGEDIIRVREVPLNT
ncbi:hypothetical protein BDP27DRAFT_1360203 [Rhodocollybia butyracea]|uniref:Uncharacterized protein n=1 Tax=Rhodocollybia butyracea TaxID=206335 RepID=A0A9P5UB07_9AGAR|nr:hypothetical protein BDP27DRAFT_1360203 [Rhodocollybia butyracea]